MRFLHGAAYLAARGFLHHLLDELPDYNRLDGELVSRWKEAPSGKGIGMTDVSKAYWTRTVWLKPFLMEFDSISKAAKGLRAMQRNWAAYPTILQRRTALIAEALPPLPLKAKTFPFDLPQSPMGGFTLLGENLLLGSALCSSPFPNGEFSFVEDRLGPPSRAYRKLWEALVMARALPSPGDFCLDAGASPGGWTWALAKLGAKVLAVDRAALDSSVLAMPGVEYLKHDAFTLKPSECGAVDWLCSDLICYPRALYEWILPWMESGLAKNFVCTIKMQGPSYDRETVDLFARIPGSKILHLWHNRHELTWINLKSSREGPEV
ncbi:MAG: SAM-dependent methyltransferase [Spirochaetia bacterium]|jgi:23S rRNA (cytidine2498-2'-O)-methyltransferase|nr:SAM-dependent methyltransferase [Spirochaetales bacterium]MDX9783932.1 SAM-dependent methyltransferase [Spirochaetia bacterium]